MMPYLSCKKIENDVYNFPTWQYCKYKDIFDSRIIINSTAKFYISISYQKDLLSIDTRIFTPSILLSVICFGIMGTSGMNTPYQMYQAYSIYIMSYGQYYLLTVVCGFIASMLAAVVSMLVAAKMHTISVAVCIPFFLYCLLPFIGRALSGYTTLFNLIPTILTNVQASVKVPLIYQIGNCVFRQIPLVMVMYTVMAIALLPFIYKSFRRYGNK